MAISETVSAMFGDDPSNERAVSGPFEGDTIERVSRRLGARMSQNVAKGWRKYVYRDGSAITKRRGWWDYGFESCWCWDTEGHRAGCEQGGCDDGE